VQFSTVARAERHYQTLLIEKAAAAEDTISAMQRGWQTCAAGCAEENSPIGRAAGGRAAEMLVRAEAFRKVSRLASQWYGQTAPSWTVQRESGEAMTSEQIRRGACVELYWSSDSADGARAFAKIAAIHEAMEQAGVTVTCLDVGRDALRTQRLAKLAPAGLRSVNIGPIPSMREISGSVLCILDGSQVVRRMYVGDCAVWPNVAAEAAEVRAGR
jgi:hypothetical protein